MNNVMRTSWETCHCGANHILEQVITFHRVYSHVGLPSISDNPEGDKATLKSLQYFPFDNGDQWSMAKSVLYPKPLPNPRIKALVVEKNCPWIKPGSGFQSLGDLKRRVAKLPTKGGEWMSAHATPSATAPAWAPVQVPFWKRDSMKVLKNLVGDASLSPHMKWAPETVLNSKNERLWSELWSGDWWREKQVLIITYSLI